MCSPRSCTLPGARERFLRDDPRARNIFFTKDGKAKPARTRIVNPAYAETLRVVARGGAQLFYEGDIAKDLVLTVRTHANRGELTEADLAGYRALEREPVCGPYRRWRICSMGPPSSGGIAVLQILGILERTAFAGVRRFGGRGAPFQRGRAPRLRDRARYLGDPDSPDSGFTFVEFFLP